MRWVGLGCVLMACGGEPSVVTALPAVPNEAPVVELRDLTLLPDEVATLRPTVSDLDGDELVFTWTLLVAPPLSEVAIHEPAASEISFLPDKLGSYVIDLAVSDGEAVTSVTGVVTLLGGTKRPVAFGGPDQLVVAGAATLLDARESQAADEEQELVYYDWRLTSAPAASTLDFRSFEPVTPFVADVEGEFRLELVVHDGSLASAPDEVVIEALPERVEPGDVAAGELLADQVYAVGLVSDACQIGLAHWSDLDTAMGAMDECQGALQVRMDHTGVVLYLQDGILRELVCDGCPKWVEGHKLEGDLSANDVVIDTAPCDGGAFDRPSNFLPGADGSMLLWCSDEWRVRGTGEVIPGTPLSFDGDVVLLSDLSLYDVASEDVTFVQIKGRTFPSPRAVRTTSGGFHVATPFEELWLVDIGTAKMTFVEAYPVLPDNEFGTSVVALDAEGSWIQRTYDFDEDRYQIRRRRLDGGSDVRAVVDPDNWLAWPSYLVSGP
ncbi:MAG: hypothetical protein KTR31_33670 [Myxococcales bacterium]|nr:hypothetical protein [Myxococcales bacterium]